MSHGLGISNIALEAYVGIQVSWLSSRQLCNLGWLIGMAPFLFQAPKYRRTSLCMTGHLPNLDISRNQAIFLFILFNSLSVSISMRERVNGCFCIQNRLLFLYIWLHIIPQVSLPPTPRTDFHSWHPTPLPIPLRQPLCCFVVGYTHPSLKSNWPFLTSS